MTRLTQTAVYTEESNIPETHSSSTQRGTTEPRDSTNFYPQYPYSSSRTEGRQENRVLHDTPLYKLYNKSNFSISIEHRQETQNATSVQSAGTPPGSNQAHNLDFQLFDAWSKKVETLLLEDDNKKDFIALSEKYLIALFHHAPFRSIIANFMNLIRFNNLKSSEIEKIVNIYNENVTSDINNAAVARIRQEIQDAGFLSSAI